MSERHTIETLHCGCIFEECGGLGVDDRACRVTKLEQALAAANARADSNWEALERIKHKWEETCESLKTSVAMGEAWQAQARALDTERDQLRESLERVRGERDKYFKALTNHLCEYDIADWIACDGHGEFSCSACKDEAPHAHAEKLQAELSRLTQELADMTAMRDAFKVACDLKLDVIEKLTRERDEAIEACAKLADESAISSRLEMGKCEESRVDYWMAAAREAERIAAHIRALKRPIQGAKP